MIEVDQSIKIEDTSRDTVLAYCARRRTHAVLVPAAVKRRCCRDLRKRGLQEKAIVLRLFAAALFLLLEEHLKRGAPVVIDDEYSGHGPAIRSMLIGWVRQRGGDCDPADIRFAQLGRRSLAHERAIRVTRGEQEPTRVLSAKQIMALL